MGGSDAGWYDPVNWPMSLRECAGCARLLSLLLDGWKVPSEDRRPPARPIGGREWTARRKRIEFLRKRLDAGRMRYWWRGRPLLASDGPATWRAAVAEALEGKGEGPDYILRDKFTDADLRWDGRGGPLHRHITPAVVARVKDRVEEALDHLYQIPADELREHFDEVYGAEWPPGLEALQEMLVDRWEQGYTRRGTALRVALKLPLRSYEPIRWDDGTSAIRVPVPLTLDQLRDLHYKRNR